MTHKTQTLQKLSSLIELLPTPILWVDLNHMILGGNSKILKAVGASSSNFIGKTAYDLYPYEMADKIIKHDEEVFRRGTTLLQEETIKNIKTGELKYFTTIKIPVPNESKKIIALIGISIEQKSPKILDALERVSKILPTPMYWEDLNSVILGGNERVFKATGSLSREAYVGKTLYELYPKEMADHIKIHNEEVMRTGKTLSQEEVIKDITTGEIKYFKAVKAPLRDDDGNMIGIVGTSIDITAEKEAAKLRKNSEIMKALELIANSFPAPIFWVNLSNFILGGNEAVFKATGALSKEAFVGKTAYDLYPYEMADKIVKHSEEVMRTGQTLSQEETITDITTGKIKYFTAVKAPLWDDNGEIIGLVGTSIDITASKENEQLEVERRLAEEKAKASALLAASIAHELRTPLASIGLLGSQFQEMMDEMISGYTLACEAGLVKTFLPEKSIQVALRSGKRLLQIAHSTNMFVDMMLMKVNVEKQKAGTLRKISILSAVQDALSAYLFDEADQALINWDIKANQKELFYFMGDQTLFNHILFNLLKNAFYYIKKGQKGEITLWLSSDKTHHFLHFKDTALGIAPKIFPHIFDEFYTKTAHGTGVGLALCKVIMREFGGNIDCQSLEGEYTHFILTFPLITKDVKA